MGPKLGKSGPLGPVDRNQNSICNYLFKRVMKLWPEVSPRYIQIQASIGQKSHLIKEKTKNSTNELRIKDRIDTKIEDRS